MKYEEYNIMHMHVGSKQYMIPELVIMKHSASTYLLFYKDGALFTTTQLAI